MTAYVSPAFQLAVVWFTLGCLSATQAAFGQADGKAAQSKTKSYFGTATCIDCHNKSKPREDPEYPPLCRCTEFVVWEKGDKHKEAFAVLEASRGRQMAELLGNIDVKKPEAGCINCHGVNVAGAKTESDFKLSDGVSCVVCHGPYLEWVDVHGSSLRSKRDEWRAKSREQKEEMYGMTDLWNPAKRAKLCVSCHVGNSAEGKVVTHAMYAAGHPPLPGIEVVTFGDEMPKHWQYLYEKDSKVQSLLKYDSTRLEKAELVMIGTAVSLRETLALVEGEAKKSIGASGAPKSLLDFAMFDCYACHHDLTTPSWRAERGFARIPGRPMPRPWPMALIPAAIRHASASADQDLRDFHAAIGKLADAFSARPFGDPAKVAAAAKDAGDWVDKLIKNLEAAKYTQADAKKLLSAACAAADGPAPDYDSARQIAWAFRGIYDQISPKPARDSEIKRKLEELDRQLMLALPSGQSKEILVELPRALTLIGGYDPAQFQSHMKELAELVK